MSPVVKEVTSFPQSEFVLGGKVVDVKEASPEGKRDTNQET